MHNYIGILVDNIHKHITNREENIQFFLSLSYERLFFCFAWFYLATDKLPKESSCFVCRALANHELVATPNECCHYFSYLFFHRIRTITYTSAKAAQSLFRYRTFSGGLFLTHTALLIIRKHHLHSEDVYDN